MERFTKKEITTAEKKKLTEKDHYARSTNYNLTKIQRTNQTKVVLKVRRSPIFFFD